MGYAKSSWGKKGGKKGSPKGKGKGKGKTQFFGQCHHCGDWGTRRTGALGNKERKKVVKVRPRHKHTHTQSGGIDFATKAWKAWKRPPSASARF